VERKSEQKSEQASRRLRNAAWRAGQLRLCSWDPGRAARNSESWSRGRSGDQIVIVIDRDGEMGSSVVDSCCNYA
jgi:hypothetical protein